MHGCAPRHSSPERADLEVAAVVEAAVGAQVDRTAFVATRRRCASCLEEFGTTGWLLAMLVDNGKKERRACRCGDLGCKTEV